MPLDYVQNHVFDGAYPGSQVHAFERDLVTEFMVESLDHVRAIERRLAEGLWWYGDSWSAMDAYLSWVSWRVEGADFPVEVYRRFADHSHRLGERPSFVRAMEIGASATALLEAEGLAFRPPPLAV